MAAPKLLSDQEKESNSALRGTRGTPRLARRSSSVALAAVIEEEMEREEAKAKSSSRRLTVSSASVSQYDGERRPATRRQSNDSGVPVLSPRSGADMICFSPKSRSSFIPSFRKRSASPSIVLDMEAPLTPRAITTLTRDRSVSSPVRPKFDAIASPPMSLEFREKPPVPVEDFSELAYSSTAMPLSCYHTQWRNPVCQGALPAGRLNHTTAVIGEKMFMFGGTDGESLKNQLFVMDLATFTWSNPATKGTPPAHRYGHSCTAIGLQLFIFGGKGKDSVFGDIHVFDTQTHTWFEIETDSISGRAYHNAWYHHGFLYIAGGQLYNGLTSNTMARFNIVTHLWKEIEVDNLKGRAMAGCVPLGKGKAALVGGVRSSKALFGSEVNSKYCAHMIIIDGPGQSVQLVKLNKDISLAGAACSGYGRSVVLSGGTRKGKVGSAASLVVVDVNTAVWTEVEAATDSGNPPPTMSGHSMVTKDDSLYIFGGKERNGSVSGSCYWLKVGSSKRSETNSFREPKSRLTKSSNVLKANLADITIVKKLATGGSGAVHLAKWKGETVVLKKYFRFDPEAFEKEVAVLGSVSHPNVVQFLSAGTDDDGDQGVLLEYLPLGDLFGVLHSNGALQWSVAIPMARQVAACMKYLHSLNIIHRDLKSSNLLVASLSPEDEVMIKVMDFGDAHELSHHKREEADACIGTTRWTAPEILEQKSTCTTKSDVYSFAIVMWEMMTGLLPYNDIGKDWKVQKYVADGGRPDIPDNWPLVYRALVQSCWDPLPEKRPSFDEVERVLKDFQRRLTLSNEQTPMKESSSTFSTPSRERKSSIGSRSSSHSSSGAGSRSSSSSSSSSSSAKRRVSTGHAQAKKVKTGTRQTSKEQGRPRTCSKSISETTLLALDPTLTTPTLSEPGKEREKGRFRQSSSSNSCSGVAHRRKSALEECSPKSRDGSGMDRAERRGKSSSAHAIQATYGTNKSHSSSRASYIHRGVDHIDAVSTERRPSRKISSSWSSAGKGPLSPKRAKSLCTSKSSSKREANVPKLWKDGESNERRTSSPATLRLSGDSSRVKVKKAHSSKAHKESHSSLLSSPLNSPSRGSTSTGSDVFVDDFEGSDPEDSMFLLE